MKDLLKDLVKIEGFYYLVFCLIVFTILGVMLYRDEKERRREKEEGVSIGTKVNGVVYREPTLYFFGKKLILNPDVDRLHFHYPYLIVERKQEFQTRVLNISTQKEGVVFDSLIIDYNKEHKVENKDNTTYFDNKDLRVNCDRAFIKSDNKVLCAPIGKSSQLLSIDTDTLQSEIVVEEAGFIITAFMYDANGDRLFVGKLNTQSNKPYLDVHKRPEPQDEQTTAWASSEESPNIVNLLFERRDENDTTTVYFASYKSALNNLMQGYYSIRVQGEKATINTESEKEIIFYQE